MKIELKCFGGLSRDYACDYGDAVSMRLNGGATVDQAIRRIGIPEDEVKITFVNGRITAPDHRLSEGDHLTLVPATGGM